MTRMDTKLVHLGRTSGRREQAVNPPLVRASATLFETVADLIDDLQQCLRHV
jgi:cystathionine beta-lyase/cystathionine gamma-synthase